MQSPDKIPFNRPYATGNELAYITEAQRNGHLSGDGAFTGAATNGSSSEPAAPGRC